MRALRPGWLVVLDSGLWAIDEFQPVAAVLDPATGAIRRVVSWRELPPAPLPQAWRGPMVCGSGDWLWVQQHPTGPVARIGVRGVEATYWSEGLGLAGCTPAGAWCAPPAPDQVIVAGADAQPAWGLVPGRLLHLDTAGLSTTIRTEGPIRSLRVTQDALLLEIDTPAWHLRELGTDLYEIEREPQWLQLAWTGPLPDVLTVAGHALPHGSPLPAEVPPQQQHFLSYSDPDPATPAPGSLNTVTASGEGQHLVVEERPWSLGWSPRPVTRSGVLWRSVLAGTRDEAGKVLQWQLGEGRLTVATGSGATVYVAVERSSWRPAPEGGPVEVLAITPSSQHSIPLLPPDAVDITEHCWPLEPKPLEADSYAQRVLADNVSLDEIWTGPDGPQPLASGLSNSKARLVGDWPNTQLEWTFDYDRYPGLRLRRRISLFDELGRIDVTEFDQIHLMEDLDTGALPTAEAARDGILDI